MKKTCILVIILIGKIFFCNGQKGLYNTIAYRNSDPNSSSISNKQRNLSEEKKFKVHIRYFCCDKTTEQGADEVYIVTESKCTKGAEYVERIPSNDGHWDMNDGNQPDDNPNGDSHCISNIPILYLNSPVNHTWNINLIFSEEDGGTSKPYQQKASEILLATGDPYGEGAGVILAGLTKVGIYLRDSDDWMGMIGIQVTNNNNVLGVNWNPKEGIVEFGPDPDAPNNPFLKQIRMNHDGSNYIAWIGVYQVN